MQANITIIGAGIAGLTMAIALKQRGFAVQVYERADELMPVGAGIILANNAMQIYKFLGLSAHIEKMGNSISTISVTDHKLNKLSTSHLNQFELKYGVSNIAIHRAAFQNVLVNELGIEHIRLSKKLVKIENSNPYILSFADSSVIEATTIVGADGIHSVIREKLLHKASIREADQYCWRGISEYKLPATYHHQALEAWGRGKRFGFVKLSDSQVYWYALNNIKNSSPSSTDITTEFNEFHPLVQAIIHATEPERIYATGIIDVFPFDKWHGDNLVLIGDAAHATTPNLGQGACQAIEDVYTLIALLDKGYGFNEATAKYNQLRLRKAHMIVQRSWNMGKLSQIENKSAIWLRNNLMKLTPDYINNRMLESIFRIEVH